MTTDAKEPYQLGLDHLVATDVGRALLFFIFDVSGVFRDPFSPEPTTHAYLSGKADIGRQLYELLIAQQPQKFLQMIEEAKND